ncbi:MAG TPA: dipeptidase PepE, partial [Bacteroidetes bacterium]|nr:dipeptidase PepE [Bacteroidota bacterium]
MKRNLLVVSTSTVHGSPYLSYIMSEVQDFFRDVDEII